MRVHRTFQFRGYVTRSGHERIDVALQNSCCLYNAALEERREAYRLRRKTITYKDQQDALKHIHAELDEWNGVSSRLSRGVLRRVDRAFQSFFRRVKQGEKPGFPRYKSNRRYRTLEVSEVTSGMFHRFEDGCRVYVTIKGLPVVGVKVRRPLPEGLPKKLLITRGPTGLMVSMTFAEESRSLRPSALQVGVDVGVSRRAVLSDGRVVGRRVVDRSRENRLRRAVARCQGKQH